MKINSDINILGGLPDFELIRTFLTDIVSERKNDQPNSSFTKIRTERSVKRFEKAIKSTLLQFNNSDNERLLTNVLVNEGITNDSLLMLFWNASLNNDLFHYINLRVFFPAFYSGRLVLKQDEISACLKDLKTTEPELNKWSDSTIETTASKYLTLLKKFTILTGSATKSIVHPHLADKAFILFIYWVLANEAKPNILESQWLQYSFYERDFFVERVMKKRYSRFISVNFSGDKLQIRPLIDYKDIYYVSSQSQSDN